MSDNLIFLGGSGYLGRRLISRFAGAGFRTAAVVRSPEAGSKIREVSPDTHILFDNALGTERYERLFNLVVDYGRDKATLERLLAVNLLYPLRLIEQINCGHVINISSGLPEDYSHYAFSKKSLERAMTYLGERSSIRCLNVHLHNFYGPGCSESNFVTFLMSKMSRSEGIDLGSCENSRDFIYIDDLVECLVEVSANFDSYGADPIPVGSGIPIKLEQLVLLIRELTGGNSPIHFGARPDNPREPRILVADTDVISRSGWQPRVSLEDGLARTLKSLRYQALPK